MPSSSADKQRGVLLRPADAQLAASQLCTAGRQQQRPEGWSALAASVECTAAAAAVSVTSAVEFSLRLLCLRSAGHLHEAVAEVVASHLVPLDIRADDGAAAEEQTAHVLLTHRARQVAEEQDALILRCS